MILTISMVGTLSACGAKSSESAVIYAGPILDNVITGIKDNNYNEFSKDFSEQMKNAITQEKFQTLVTTFDSKIGDYEGRTLSSDTTITKDNKSLTVVVYKALYSKEPNGVQITITFSDNNGKKIIEGLYFNSPNLQK